LIGVWDVDSPLIGRFDADDQHGMEALVAAYVAASHPARVEAAA
jgi:L-methionine (R)-S-oxide reductase